MKYLTWYNAGSVIIDFHTHIVPPEIISKREKLTDQDLCLGELFGDPKARMATVDDLISSMDKDGIDFSVVVNMGWASYELCKQTNDYIMEAVQRFPERLAGFGMIHPQWKECQIEIERCASGGMIGIGELMPHLQGYDLGNKELMEPLMETVRKCGMMIMTHSSEPVGHLYPGKGNVYPDMLYRFITNFPEQKIVCAHWGGGLPFYSLMPEVSRSLENIWFDTAASPFLYKYDVFRIVADIIGPERILFGSDFPLITQKRIIKGIDEKIEMDGHWVNMILGENAVKLLGIS